MPQNCRKANLVDIIMAAVFILDLGVSSILLLSVSKDAAVKVIDPLRKTRLTRKELWRTKVAVFLQGRMRVIYRSRAVPIAKRTKVFTLCGMLKVDTNMANSNTLARSSTPNQY